MGSANTIQINLSQAGEFETFRVAFYAGLSPGRIEVVADNISPAQNRRNLNIPIQLPDNADGLITLLITGVPAGRFNFRAGAACIGRIAVLQI